MFLCHREPHVTFSIRCTEGKAEATGLWGPEGTAPGYSPGDPAAMTGILVLVAARL